MYKLERKDGIHDNVDKQLALLEKQMSKKRTVETCIKNLCFSCAAKIGSSLSGLIFLIPANNVPANKGIAIIFLYTSRALHAFILFSAHEFLMILETTLKPGFLYNNYFNML